MTDIPKELLEGFLLHEERRIEPSYKQHPTQGIHISNNYTSPSSMDGFLRDLQGGKLMSIKEVIDDIEALITIRKDLQDEVFGDINKLMTDISNFMTAQTDKIDAVEMLKMKEKLLDIEEFKMQEKINAFRDIALLKKELRDRVQEYKEQGNRISVIDDLLGG